jgi:acyl-coenzyme A synthetase/AMP-(fatty) acid ligase
VLGSVGEPINPEAWLWYYKKIGKEKCSIVDTFWQTETGGHVITPIPGATPMKPGSAVSGKIEKKNYKIFHNLLCSSLLYYSHFHSLV